MNLVCRVGYQPSGELRRIKAFYRSRVPQYLTLLLRTRLEHGRGSSYKLQKNMSDTKLGKNWAFASAKAERFLYVK